MKTFFKRLDNLGPFRVSGWPSDLKDKMTEKKVKQTSGSSYKDPSRELMELRESSIHDRGVFATVTIAPGQRIIQYLGEEISAEECDRREQLYSELEVTYLFDLENGYAIDGGVNGNLAIYINHSCDPNCLIEFEGNNIWVVARRPVVSGEELTYDYWFDPADDDATTVPCHCRSTACRGTINRPRDIGCDKDSDGEKGGPTIHAKGEDRDRLSPD